MDTGGAEARAVSRKLRALKSLAVVVDGGLLPPDALTGDACGVVLAGSGLLPGAAETAAREALKSGLPVLALGRSARLLLLALGAQPGATRLEKATAHVQFLNGPLFEGLSEAERYFERAEEWTLPEGVHVSAEGEGGFAAAAQNEAGTVFAAQFGVESNDPDGMQMLKNFAEGVCGLNGEWTMPAFLDDCVTTLRASCPEGEVIAAVSGGAPSIVAAALASRAFGERARCVLMDTGLFRKGEVACLRRAFEEELGMPLHVKDISSEVAVVLSGAADTREKHERVVKTLRDALLNEGRAIVRGAGQPGDFSLLPLNALYREEIRELGELLGLPPRLLSRQPFPESGLAIRMSGEATAEKLELLRESDAAFCEEIETAGLDRKLHRYYATLTGTDTGAYAVVLHALVSPDTVSGYAFRLPYDVIERAVMRILKNLSAVEGVLYDVTGR